MNIKAFLLNEVTDLPASASTKNFCGHGAYQGCCFCLTTGKYTRVSDKGGTVCYPFETPKSTLRGFNETVQNAFEATTADHQVFFFFLFFLSLFFYY